MEIIIYVLSGVSIFFAIGGLSAYAQTKHIGLLLSSIISIGCSLLAIDLVQWWPLIVGFLMNTVLGLLGFDPGRQK